MSASLSSATTANTLKTLRALAFCGGVVAWWQWSAINQVAQWDRSLTYWIVTIGLFGAAFLRPWRLRRPDWTSAAVASLIIAAVIARGVALETVPYAVALDEALHPLYGKLLLEHYTWRLFEVLHGYFYTPQLDFVVQASLTPWLPALFAGRLATVILSLISLMATYALGARLFNRTAGAFAVMILACSHWHLAYSRMAHPYMQAIAIVVLTLFVLVYALETGNSFLSYCGGVLLGASMFVYTPARIVVPVFALWWLHATLRRRLRWRSLLPIGLGAAVFVSPFLQAQGWGTLLFRFNQTVNGSAALLPKVEAAGWSPSSVLRVIAEQVGTSLSIYVGPGAWWAPHDVSRTPLVDVVTLALVVAGLGLCLVRMRESRCFMLVAWTGAVVVLGQVFTDVPQAAYRAAPALPAAAIAAGLVLERLAAVLSRVAGRPATTTAAVVGALTLTVLLPANLAAFDVFLGQRRNDPMTASARIAAAQERGTVSYFIAPTATAKHEVVQLIVGDAVAVDVPGLSDTLGKRLGGDTSEHMVAFILHPQMRAAESVIRRCYPGSMSLAPQPPGAGEPVVALLLNPTVVDSGLGCEADESTGRGLRATYFEDGDFDGRVVRTRIEDWPVRWIAARHLRDFGSIEWRGFLHVPVSGTYDLRLPSLRDSATASIGDIELSGDEPFHGQLSAGLYPLRWRCKAVPGTLCALQWVPPGGELQLIPPEFLRTRADQGSQVENGRG